MKNIFYRLPAIVLFILCFNKTGFCQNLNISGYVIDAKGDSLLGSLDIQRWEKEPGKIRFMDPSGNVNVFSASQVKKFGYGRAAYISSAIKTEVSNENLNAQNNNPDFVLETDTVFLQSLISGPKELFYFMNRVGKHQFYIKQNGAFELLLHKKYLKESDGRVIQTENKKFLTQLSEYLNGCDQVQMQLNEILYTRNSLQKLFKTYYDCQGGTMEITGNSSRGKFRFGVLAGGTHSSIQFRSNFYDYLTKAKYSPSTNFAAGIYLGISLQRGASGLLLNNELLYTSYQFSSEYHDRINDNQYTHSRFTLGLSYLKLNNMLRYEFPTSRISPFINAGITNGIVINEKNIKTEEKKFYTTETTQEGKTLDKIRKIETGWNMGAGIRFREFSFEGRFEKTNGMSEHQGLDVKLTRAYFLIGYGF